MTKRLFTLALVLLSLVVRAQVQSPEQFLGYKVGTKFTPHWKIVDYFRHVAAQAPSMVKLQQYGATNEGRPLLVVFVSQAQHISNLEAIRLNNLRLASSTRDRAAANTQAPAIVWMSYNVHGNEASSSEASMLTLYALVDPRNTATKGWMQNTVVAIDPCLNPDGRDRYVNWYNSIAGKKYDPYIGAREHNEPWPGGRVNHYNFDLNRDWAWQTQVESQARVKLYNEWLPQIHVDFHEQYPDAPYYFAPAAEPYHEVITPFQRSFQNTIGRNHARYFDAKGWLYFTRQYFDLLYPSYGDTYPIYNGSIGMTYEQAGHGIAGLGIQMEKGGDTLTLVDRAEHHFTTSLSTIEVASQNAGKLIGEFQRYFNEAVSTGIGTYKSYVIRQGAGNKDRMQALIALLQKNGISYSSARGGTARGYNYETGKDESFTVLSSDLLIPAVQPKSALVKVLFEPKSALADSFTYDITAWSLPYAYGLKAWASTQALPQGAAVSNPTAVLPRAGNNTYGLVIPWNGLSSVRFAGTLLQRGIRIRYSEEAFETGGRNFERGSLIILKTGNQYFGGLWDTVLNIAARTGAEAYEVSSGFVDKGYDFGSNKVRTMANRRVALITGEGVSANAAGEVWYFFEQELDYPLTLINAADISFANWNDFDVVIMPNGRYPFLNDKGSAEAFRNWVSAGGKVIAMEGAVNQLAAQEWSIKSKKVDEADSKDAYAALKRYENREREFLPNNTPGSIFRVELDNTHPLAFGYPGFYYTLKQDDRIYDFIKEGGWNVGVIKKEKQVSGFVGSRLQARLQDGLLFGVQDLGRGSITYLADDVLFRNFWQNGKLMFANAVFLVGQ